MRMRVNLLSVGLLVLLFSLSVSAQNICEKTTKENYVQRDYYKEYPMAAAPDSKFEFPTYGNYYVVLSGFRLVDDPFWGPALYLQVNYCNKVTHNLDLKFELRPQGTKDPGVGYPAITYYGPIKAPDNTRCLSVAIKEEKFSGLNSLLFSGVRSAPETLLFKRVLSRQMRVSKASVVNSVKPRVSVKVGSSNPRPLGEPEVDPYATASCYASVVFGT